MAPIWTPLILDSIFAPAESGTFASAQDAGRPASVSLPKSRLENLSAVMNPPHPFSVLEREAHLDLHRARRLIGLLRDIAPDGAGRAEAGVLWQRSVRD